MLRREMGMPRAPDNGPAGRPAGPHHGGPNAFVRYGRTDGIAPVWLLTTTIVCVVPVCRICRCHSRANPGQRL